MFLVTHDQIQHAKKVLVALVGGSGLGGSSSLMLLSAPPGTAGYSKTIAAVAAAAPQGCAGSWEVVAR
jgi:hypothetical protein